MYSFYLAAMMMAVMTLGLTACGSDDDEPESGDLDYFEVTIDGNTKTLELPVGLGIVTYMSGYKDANGKEMSLVHSEGLGLGRMGNIMMPFAVYTYKSDFNMKAGTYSFRPITNAGEVIFDDWWNFMFEEDDVKKPFETAINLTVDGKEYYSTIGTLKVTSIDKRQVTILGQKTEGYLIKATFTCTLAKEKDKSDTKECNGRFSLTYFPEDD